MTLGTYVRRLMGDLPIAPTAKAMGIAHGSLHNVMTDAIAKPQPITLERIAVYFGGEDEDEQRRIYADLMRLAGHLDLMPTDDDENAYRAAGRKLEGSVDRIAERHNNRTIPEQERLDEEETQSNGK
jgi:hypothetical protein